MSENEAVGASGGLVPVTEGEWAGWSTWQSDAFEQRAGPFYERRDDDGSMVAAFRAEERHMNGAGFMHGGCMMTFADSAIFTIATDELEGSHGVTMHLGHVFDAGPAERLEPVCDAPGPVLRCEVQRDVVGVVIADDPVVGRDDVARRRVP